MTEKLKSQAQNNQAEVKSSSSTFFEGSRRFKRGETAIFVAKAPKRSTRMSPVFAAPYRRK